MSHCSHRLPLGGLLTLLAIAVATAFAPAAHATPPGANGDLFVLFNESNIATMFDAAQTPDDDPFSPPVWNDGVALADLASSPDGQHMAYISAQDNRIAIATTSGTDEHLLPGTDNVDDLTYSPDGQRIAFTKHDRIWTVPVDGSAAPQQLGGTFVGAEGIDWAADDTEIVVSAAGAGGHRDLYAVDPQTGAGHPLTATATLDESEPTFAPDGSKLAFGVRDDATLWRIDVADADGGNRHALVTEDGAEWPSWSPDGTRIAYFTGQPVNTERVATIQVDGTGRHPVTSYGGVQLMWAVKPGTGNKLPLASFTVAPAQPYTGGDTVLTDTSTDPDGTIAAQEWDLDGDGAYDDATGPVAHVTFAAAGDHEVGLRVRDNRGSMTRKRTTVTVLQGGKPGAAFSVDPTTPLVDRPATFTAAINADPNAQVVHHQWDFDGDGTWDADTGTQRTVQHTYTSVGKVTARLRVTDAEGDQATQEITFDVADEVRCGQERAGRLTIDGCLVVKGDRRLAPQGVSVNGVTFGATDTAEMAIDVAAGRAVAIPKAQAQDVLDGRVGLPDAAQTLPISACGDDLGTATAALSGFTGAGDVELPFQLRDGKTFAGLRPSSIGKLKFGDGVADFDVSGLLPRLLLNWTAEARGDYHADPDCAKRKLVVHVGSFASRFITIPEIRLEWTGGNRFDGLADIRLSPMQFLPSGKVQVTAIDGHIRTATLHYGNVPIGGGFMMKETDITLRLDHDQEELSGHTEVGTVFDVLGETFTRISGTIRLGRNGFHVEGLIDVVGQRLGYGHVDIDFDRGVADMGIEVDFHLGPAYAEADVEGYVDAVNRQAELLGNAKIGLDGIGHLGGQLALTSRGIGACGDFGPLHPGFSYHYGDTWPKVFVKSCDFGDVRVARAATASAAAAGGSRSVPVAGGQRGAVLVANGRPGHAPRVEVTGPGGVRIVSRADGKASKQPGRWLVVPNDQDGTTNVLLVAPAGGTWEVRALGGGTLRSVGTASALPKPSVKVQRTKKALRWTLRPIAGQVVRFVEVHADGSRRVLKSTSSRRGTIKYIPAAGTKRIVAEVLQNGLVRETRVALKIKK